MSDGVLIAIFGGAGVVLAETVKVIVEGVMNKIGKGKESQIAKRFDDLDKKIDDGFSDVNDRIAEVMFDVELDRVKNARIRILRYADEITSGVEHSKESFDQALLDIDEYQDYCRLHPEFENNRTTLANDRIRSVYKELMKENGFL